MLGSFGFGQTRHARSYPAHNAFAVGTVFLRLPMRALRAQPPQRLTGLGAVLFGINRPALLGFRDRDHGERTAAHGSALAWVDALLHREGIADCTGEVWLHTFPAVLSYAFKPVSFWFCHRANGELGAVLAEVHNTFGEQHCYLLHHASGAALKNGQQIVAKKMFHVSPFFPVRGEYCFSWAVHPERSVLRIAYYDAAHQPAHPDEVTLTTSISGQHAAISVTTCIRALLSYPAQAFSVVARIYWQALKLWFKKVRFYSKPSLPARGVTHSTEP
jgi:DUF1365 family protein